MKVAGHLFMIPAHQYSRSRSRGDVSPLIAAAMALYVAELELQPGDAVELAIY